LTLSDTAGAATWSYVGSGGIGTDRIFACYDAEKDVINGFTDDHEFTTTGGPTGGSNECLYNTDPTNDASTTAIKNWIDETVCEITGTAGQANCGLRRSGATWSFSGGGLPGAGITINYRQLKESCTFTATTNSVVTLVTGELTITNLTNSCDPTDEDYTIRCRDRSLDPPRGSIAVIDGGGEPFSVFNIPSLDFPTKLCTGNAHVE
jgi:hypothetical protein